MHLKESDSHPSGYRIRPSADAPERGPFSLESLHDLAEFQHVTPDFLVRPEGEEEWRPLRDLPELMAAIFPARKAYQFKSYTQQNDPDAGYTPVDVRNIYRCDGPPSRSSPPPPPVSRPAPPDPAAISPGPPPPRMDRPEGAAPGDSPAESEAIAFDVAKMLEESEAISRARQAERGEERQRWWQAISFPGGSFMIRWLVAFFLFVVACWIWSDPGTGTVVVVSMLLGLFPMALAIILTAGDIIDWFISRFERLAVRDAVEFVDYREAEAKLAAGDWAGATSAYLTGIEKAPHQLRGYLGAIAAATAAGDQKKLATFQAFALKHLSVPDRNLLSGALNRRGLPPLPVRRAKA